ncbi:hypothetical protein PGT21_025130 [Puccinia graminis f. sp. tritici]|uniref:Uncharacterized protein n=1 Tax=Puccinia graminis f. sp. tritici TaxID=56615 RepID=A0A5B0MS75_PUCGR|nr:hypothetical protein PGT21_025130 [Puccinia graminis f. sp. tritici]KAA1100729.1 hypothetical protein PGTUg99_020535 [Puccinia graminis f. sp. tritici]
MGPQATSMKESIEHFVAGMATPVAPFSHDGALSARWPAMGLAEERFPALLIVSHQGHCLTTTTAIGNGTFTYCLNLAALEHRTEEAYEH